MVEGILYNLSSVFAACASWTQELLNAVGGTGVVVAAFCIVLAIGLLFMPMRGRMSATSFVSDYQSYKHSQAKKEAFSKKFGQSNKHG